MTEFELYRFNFDVNRQLALAIGWKPALMTHSHNSLWVWVDHGYPTKHDYPPLWPWKKFDYLDWNVIGPIAERYGVSPSQ